MNPAKRSLQFILGFTAIVIVASFAIARLGKNRSEIGQSKSASNQTSPLPLFYKSVGGSNPGLAVERRKEKVEKFTINIRTLSTKSEAEALIEKLTQAGFFSYYTPVRQIDKVLYHVRIGVYSSENEATNTVLLLQKRAALNGTVTKLQ